jgi:hypothetical protein
MALISRANLKKYFETGDKPTEAQFADLIGSVFNLKDDGAQLIVTYLESLFSTARLNKSAVQGADFALNRRGKGDVYNGQYTPGMVNIRRGDFWIYDISSPPPPEKDDPLNPGDWIIALTDNIQQPFDYDDETKWWQLRWPSASSLQNVIDFVALHGIQHYFSSDTVLADPGDTINLESRLAMFEAFAKIKWVIDSDDPDTETHTLQTRDCSVVINAPGAYNVKVEVFDQSGTLLAQKEAANMLLVQNAALYSVVFRVTDYAGAPVRYAYVTFDGTTKQTMADGRATFANLVADTYTYSVQKAGFATIGPLSLVVSANVVDHPVNLVLAPYIENAEITGFGVVGATVKAEYDFVPEAYEGATEITWWVEDYLGNIIVSKVKKIKGTHSDYDEFVIPELAAGHKVIAEIKAYDLQTNTNSNMLASPFLLVDELNLPAFIGYRLTSQTDPIDGDIVTGVTDPSQQADLLKLPDPGYPQPVNVPWQSTFLSLDELTRYDLWFAIPEEDTTEEYAYYQNMLNPGFTAPFTFDDVLSVDVTINGTAYPYKVYVTNQGPINFAFKNEPFN